MRPQLLLITRYFPPLDSIATMRMQSWAYYLNKFGYQVTVLTTTKQNQVHHPLLLDTSGINCIEIPYFDPIAALSGSQTKNEGPQKPLHRFYRARMNERMPNRTDFWIKPALRELQKQHRMGMQYDYIVSSYGPPSSHIVGYFAKKLFKSRWLADYRDLWLENHAYKGLWPFTLLESWAEKKCISKADVLTTVSEGLRNTLSQKFPNHPVYTITNGYEPQLLNAIPQDFFPNDGVFRMVYTGKVCHGHPTKILLTAISELVHEGKLKAGKFQLLFYGRSIADLSSLIEFYQLHPWVQYGGTLPLADAYRAQRSANALLFLERAEIDGILTGKLFEYLSAPAPILAVGITPEMEAARIIEETGSGIICGTDVQLIKHRLLELVEGRYHGRKRLEQIANYSREKQAEKLFNILNELNIA